MCICLILILPEVIISFTRPKPFAGPIPVDVYLKISVFLSVFYINYFFIANRTLLRGNITRYTTINTVIITSALLVLYLGWKYVGPPDRHTVTIEHPDWSRWGFLPMLSRDAGILIVLVLLCAAIKGVSRWKDMGTKRNELLAARRETELAHLRSQLNPHFFFNTLNSIYALIEIDPDQARTAIHKLSKMMRYMIYDIPTTASMAQELDFIRNYLSLMAMRLSHGFPLRITLPANEDVAALRIAPLIFINPIDNAFKYGMGINTPNAGIDISVKADKSGIVYFRISNGYCPETVSHKPKGAGIGLSNLRRRLALRYPDAHSISIDDTGSRFTVEITIDTFKTLK